MGSSIPQPAAFSGGEGPNRRQFLAEDNRLFGFRGQGFGDRRSIGDFR
jgi:hypothetical protein